MPAETGRDTTFRMTLQGAERRYWVNYGELANFTFAAPPGNFAEGRGELFLGNGDAMLPAAKGLRVRGVLSQLDVGPWQDLVNKYAGQDPGGSAKQLLSSADFKVGKLSALGTTLDQASVQLTRKPAAWALQLDSQQVKGAASIPDAKAAPWSSICNTCDCRHLIRRFLPTKTRRTRWPPWIRRRSRRWISPSISFSRAMIWSVRGRSRFVLRPRDRPQLTGYGPQRHPVARQRWLGRRARFQHSWYKGRISGKNLADVLKGWGFAPSVTSQEFHMDVDGRWPGSPAWLASKRFSGTLDASLREGQFVEVEGGAQALRVFGLLNFNSIGRRLRLDFSDLFGKGLSYDRVKGLLVATNGVYVTREPIQMTGPSSNVELNGTLDLVGDQVDAKLLVTLPVTNNLPIAALIVGAPAVGGALFLIDKLIGDRVARFASVKYTVKGPWKEPKITFDKPFDARTRQAHGVAWTSIHSGARHVCSGDSNGQPERCAGQPGPGPSPARAGRSRRCGAGGAAGKLRGHGPARHCRHRPRRGTGRRSDPALVETDRPRPQVMDSGRHLAAAAGGPAAAKVTPARCWSMIRVRRWRVTTSCICSTWTWRTIAAVIANPMTMLMAVVWWSRTRRSGESA
jgi:uncharacterized protein YhdP